MSIVNVCISMTNETSFVEKKHRMAEKGCDLHLWVHDVVFICQLSTFDSDVICIDPVVCLSCVEGLLSLDLYPYISFSVFIASCLPDYEAFNQLKLCPLPHYLSTSCRLTPVLASAGRDIAYKAIRHDLRLKFAVSSSQESFGYQRPMLMVPLGWFPELVLMDDLWYHRCFVDVEVCCSTASALKNKHGVFLFMNSVPLSVRTLIKLELEDCLRSSVTMNLDELHNLQGELEGRCGNIGQNWILGHPYLFGPIEVLCPFISMISHLCYPPFPFLDFLYSIQLLSDKTILTTNRPPPKHISCHLGPVELDSLALELNECFLGEVVVFGIEDSWNLLTLYVALPDCLLFPSHNIWQLSLDSTNLQVGFTLLYLGCGGLEGIWQGDWNGTEVRGSGDLEVGGGCLWKIWGGGVRDEGALGQKEVEGTGVVGGVGLFVSLWREMGSGGGEELVYGRMSAMDLHFAILLARDIIKSSLKGFDCQKIVEEIENSLALVVTCKLFLSNFTSSICKNVSIRTPWFHPSRESLNFPKFQERLVFKLCTFNDSPIVAVQWNDLQLLEQLGINTSTCCHRDIWTIKKNVFELRFNTNDMINKLKMKVFVMGTHFEIGVKLQDMVVIRATTPNMRLKDYMIEIESEVQGSQVVSGTTIKNDSGQICMIVGWSLATEKRERTFCLDVKVKLSE
ncbi:hypothetical protein Tco_1407981 [Tanacetum coccineum]